MKTKNLKAMCVGSPRIFTGWKQCNRRYERTLRT